ncbi:MAG: hypothetical protein HYU69_12140 [Bacteroidetes bacterium]|nr:hypothetical protein [Bacteroidota bacterium]
MTKEEFITNWLQDMSNKPNCPDREYFDKHFVVLPCDCNDKTCNGWRALFNHPLIVENHNRIFNPETRNRKNPPSL